MEQIWKIAKKYLNTEEVNIFSINTMLTKNSKIKNYVVNMHADFDSANMVAFFVYWTDVSKKMEQQEYFLEVIYIYMTENYQFT